MKTENCRKMYRFYSTMFSKQNIARFSKVRNNASEILASKVTLYSTISIIATLKYHVFEKYYGKWSICSFGANAPFSIIFSKVFKTFLKFFKNYFQCCLKIENDVMIKK